MALRAKPVIVLACLRGRGFAARARHPDSSLLQVSQQQPSMLDLLCTMTVGEKAKVPDAHETIGQDVEEKSTDELFGPESHRSGLVAMAVVAPSEGDAAVVVIDEAVVGNRDAAGIAAALVDHLLRQAKGRIGVDHPFASSR